MPCLTGRSKHNLCKPKVCNDEDLCPCTPTTAFSCRPACDKNECCRDREAYGRVNSFASGITGPRGLLDETVSNNGILSVVRQDTGEYDVTFEKNFFSDCELIPAVFVSACAGTLSDLVIVACDNNTTTETARVLTRLSTDGSTRDDTPFFIRAIQKANC